MSSSHRHHSDREEHHRRHHRRYSPQRRSGTEHHRRRMEPDHHRRRMEPGHHRRRMEPEHHRRRMEPEYHRRRVETEYPRSETGSITDILDSLRSAFTPEPSTSECKGCNPPDDWDMDNGYFAETCSCDYCPSCTYTDGGEEEEYDPVYPFYTGGNQCQCGPDV